MPMPAFDMEPASTSLPEGRPAPPSPDETAAVAPLSSAEPPAMRPNNGGAAAARPPLASLTSITGKLKSAPSEKAGDLTRLFASRRHQVPGVPIEPGPAPEPAPIAAAPLILDRPPEPQLMPIERAVAEVPPRLEPAPESPPIEPMDFAEPLLLSELALDEPTDAALAAESQALSPIGAADAITGTAESLPAFPEPVDRASVSLMISEPTPDLVEAPAIPASSLKVEPTVPPAPEPSRSPEWVPVRAPRTMPATPKFVELADYWRALCNGDDHPAAEAVDRDFVTERWPGSLLIAYTPASQDPQGEPRPGRVTRLGAACAATQKAVDAGSHSTEWMLEVARTALINDEPVEEQQRLATITGEASFRMVALPLGPPKGQANAVLCTLLPGPGAPRFGKRRIWL